MRLNTMTIIFVGILLSMSSCDIVNPEEPIPAYIVIPEFILNTEPLTHGTNSHKITEAQVFVANELIGIFSLPATIPVLAEGTQEIQVFPSVRSNGLGDITDVYPFYERYQTTLDFIPGNIDTILPVTNYLDDLRMFFEPEENFEDGTLTFAVDLDGDPDTKIEITTQEVFEGSGSGLIEMEKSDAQIEVGSNLISDLPLDISSTTYLELNYKTEARFLVGVLGYDDQGRIIYSMVDKGVNPNDAWNKIYFDFTQEIVDLIALEDQLAGWRLVIIADLFENEADQANIYLDNIKLVQFR